MWRCSIAGGQNSAFFLVTPNEKYSDLQRHPAELDTPEECLICHQDNGDPLACDKVRGRGEEEALTLLKIK